MLFAVAAVAAVAIIRLWLLPIVNSFWLDETLIVRTIRGGFSQVASNAAASLQSVGFCSVEWLVSRAWNASEIALRLPSIVAALASLYVYYRLGVEFIDREAGLIFASLYIMLPQVAFEVPNARPYSLALLAHAGALLWLLRWTRSGLLRHGLWWTLCAAAACHLQPLFVLGLGVEGFFVLWLLLKSTAIRPRDFAICGAVAVILLLPALSQAVAMSRQAALLSFVDRPSLGSVLPVIFPFYALGAAAIMAVITRLEGTPLRWTAMKDASNLNVLAALLLFAPTFGLLALSLFTSVRLFDARYLLPTVPGMVMLWGRLLRSIEPFSFRTMTAVAGMVVATMALGHLALVPNYRPEDWRTAVRSMPGSGAILAYSGLVETRRLDWLQQPEHWGYLMSPVLAYRPSITAENGFVVPFEFGAGDQQYLEGLLEGSLRNRDSITVIVRRIFWGPEWLSWISARLLRSGFQKASDDQYGRIELAVFRRRGKTSARAGLMHASIGN